MIRSFIWDEGASEPVRSEEGFVPEPPRSGWVWIDLADEEPETIREVCTDYGVDPFIIEEALAAGSLPSLEEQRDLIYVVLNAFHSAEEGRLRATEVDLFLGARFLISVHTGDMASTQMVRERLEQGVELPVATPAGLLAHLALAGSRRFPPLIEHLESQLDGLEELAMLADPRAITEVQALRRDVILLRKVLIPQRQIYDELAEAGHPLIDEPSRAMFERVTEYQTRLLETLEAARSLLGTVLETHRGAVADQTNEIFRVLTVFSAIMLPLSLIAGIFGMNFVEIPLAEDTRGFWIISGGMLVGGIVLWLYFGRRGFVGAPRLRDLPKAVGLGLYQVGTAPIRVVAEGIESTIRVITGTLEEEEKPPQP